MTSRPQLEAKIDEAQVEFINGNNEILSVYYLLSECVDCAFAKLGLVKPKQNASFFISTKYEALIEVRTTSRLICDVGYQSLQDQGGYRLMVNGETCELEEIVKGRNNVWPLVALLVVISLLSLASYAFKKLSRGNQEVPEQTVVRKPRIKSLDAFRGAIIMLMVFVNNGGGEYAFLNHAPWFGYTLADLVFPSFLFIMGTSMALSLKSQVAKCDGRSLTPVYTNIVKRSLWLFFLGLIVNSIGETRLSHLRILGVLQRFAVSYIIMASLHVFTLSELRGTPLLREEDQVNDSWRSGLLQKWPRCLHWIVVALSTLIYLCFTYLWNYSEECPKGYQGPGGLHENGTFFNCTGGAARAIDIAVFGNNHIYNHSAARHIYHNTLSHDPEGLLGCTTSIIIVFFGIQAGQILISERSVGQKFVQWFKWASFSLFATLCLVIDDWNPLCKNLWSLSYVCLSTSFSFVLFALFYLLIDVSRIWNNGFPFIYPGMNSIAIYVGHEITHNIFPWYFDVDKTSHFWLLFRAFYTTFLWLLISVFLAKKRIFIAL